MIEVLLQKLQPQVLKKKKNKIARLKSKTFQMTDTTPSPALLVQGWYQNSL